jgi:protein gp37
MGDTHIQWTNKTWNPWHGCHKISPGCKNCYMFSDKARYGQDPNVVVRSKTLFNAPLKWTDPALVFTCSWSDWFIEEADEWRHDARDIILRTPHLTYQILTKRPERAARWIPAVPDPNVWLGVSVEDRKYGLPRIDVLRELPAAVRFLSIEPQLEDLGEINLSGIHWVIIGGESGPAARPFNIGAAHD